MRIVICGSMAFAKEILSIKQRLSEEGHIAIVPKNIEKYASRDIKDKDKWRKIESDVIRAYYEEIKQADAVLVCNKSKNHIENYVGGSSLIEMAFAHVLGKKIFLLNQVPQMNYSDEIIAMNPIIINNDLSRIE